MFLNNLKIRLAQIGDLPVLQKIGKQTFIDAFGSLNTASDMELYLEKTFNLKQLETEIQNPESEYYFIEDPDRILGYLKVNVGAAQTETISNALEIERIYVIVGYQSLGIGKILFNKAIDLAKERNLDVIWLGVWEKNLDAIRLYKKLGFIQFSSHPFLLGQDEQTDLLMKLKLT